MPGEISFARISEENQFRNWYPKERDKKEMEGLVGFRREGFKVQGGEEEEKRERKRGGDQNIILYS